MVDVCVSIGSGLGGGCEAGMKCISSSVRLSLFHTTGMYRSIFCNSKSRDSTSSWISIPLFNQ